jgi:hypothetical protein
VLCTDFPAMLATVARRTTRFRSLRSLRSDKCDKSVIEARCARGHGHCASRRLTRRATTCPHTPWQTKVLALTGGKPKRFMLRQALSGGGDVPGWLCPPVWGRARPNSLRSLALSPLRQWPRVRNEARTCAPGPRRADTATPEHRPTGQRLPQQEVVGYSTVGAPKPLLPRCGWVGRSAPVRRREAQWPWPRAQRASSTDSSHLSERRERQRTQPVVRRATATSIAGKSARSADRLTEALRPARTRLGSRGATTEISG